MTGEFIGLAAFLVGLHYLRTRRGPVATVVGLLLHLQAAWLCARQVAPKAWLSARASYPECYQRARREAGR